MNGLRRLNMLCASRRVWSRACVAGLLLIGCGTAPAQPPGQHIASAETTSLPPLPTLNPSDIATGQTLYAQQCASCHGANLQGQPDWKKPLANGKYPAPPHDNSGHTWHHNDTILTTIILNGGDGTGNMSHGDMPAFKDKLTETQVRQILSFFKSHWGQPQREYQWARTTAVN